MEADMVYILHNPLSGGANFEEAEGKIKEQAELEGQTFEVKDITKIEDMVGFFKGLAEDDRVVILGGDGTLNHLANDIRGYQPKNPLYVYSGGTGNDYIRDIRKEGEEEKCLFQINEDIINLPVVVIDGKAYSFLNNVSYGLDGEVCVGELPADVTSPVSRVDRNERHALLRAAVAELPANDRAIIVLRHFDGMGNSECAAALGIAPKAASIRYVRALERLQQKLMELSCFKKIP
jgi:RNA polymerase sigma factor (sigma-70 family)